MRLVSRVRELGLEPFLAEGSGGDGSSESESVIACLYLQIAR